VQDARAISIKAPMIANPRFRVCLLVRGDMTPPNLSQSGDCGRQVEVTAPLAPTVLFGEPEQNRLRSNDFIRLRSVSGMRH